MPVFEYTALDQKGKNRSGIIDADSATDARQKLKNKSLYPTSLKEAPDHLKTSSASKSKGFNINLQGFFTRVKSSEVTIMTRQLATLVGAGLPLVTAISSLLPQTPNPAFKQTLAQIKDSIVEGNSFAKALEQYPKIFSELFINMVRAGEASGALEIVLDRLADLSEKQQQLKGRIRSALAYPIFMLFLGCAVLFVLMAYIVPNITSIFDDMGQTLPGPTLFLIAMSSFIERFWWVILLLCTIVVIVIRQLIKTEKGKYTKDRLLLTFPLTGTLAQKLAVSRFGRTLGSLIENGVSLIPALGIVKNVVGNVLIADIIDEAVEDIGKGEGLGNALSKSEIFPPISIQMIQVGEQSGELEKMLNKVADIYETEVESAILAMTSMLEPLMILTMGVLMGFVVISILLPIVEMNQLVK
ncbi:MAG: type II secretion system inner membrane protein GspF [Candidatus Magnetomorum sp.]|nr:type II secretion system inner membrane protein GspF [Candidatus Magnetomorum sp.]